MTGDVLVGQDIRIGQILIEQGVLSDQQVLEIVEAQRAQKLPFGVLAERLFDVTIQSIERAWVEQYLRMTGIIDLRRERIDEGVLTLINRRQAWQFQILPLHFEQGGELVMAASSARLARAITFAVNRLKPVIYFRIAELEQLRLYLMQHYPMPEISEDIMQQARQMA